MPGHNEHGSEPLGLKVSKIKTNPPKFIALYDKILDLSPPVFGGVDTCAREQKSGCFGPWGHYLVSENQWSLPGSGTGRKGSFMPHHS